MSGIKVEKESDYELHKIQGDNIGFQMLKKAGGSRVAIYSLENAAGTPIYVHAKVCIIDDTWACVGSDNANRRSWTHDSELSCAVLDTVGGWPRQLRLELVAEHLGHPLSEEEAIDPVRTFRALPAIRRRSGSLASHRSGRSRAVWAAAPVHPADPLPYHPHVGDPRVPASLRPGRA